MNLNFTTEENAFRDMVRAFIESKLPADGRRAQRMTTTFFSEFEMSAPWHRILHRKGWVAPAWPKEHGGTGWSISQRYIWAFECARAGTPRISPIALNMVGPVLIRFGTEEQRAKFLPRILSGEDYWCQGFSEPQAGSDLAALQLRAVEEDGFYRLNGNKIWTTHAHFAGWMIALVRTADTGKRQQGITCLLVDMKSPGITVRPIHTIGGDHEVNQVFFDDVYVPVAGRVGEAGAGWSIAKYLLQFERGGGVVSPSLRTALAAAQQLADAEGVASREYIQFRTAEIGVDIDALEMLELRTNCALKAGQNPGATSSILKLRVSQLQQAVSDLALQILGEAGLRWEPRRPLYAIKSLPVEEEERITVASRYLNNRANTIFGGSSEIQKTIIARDILGL